MKKLTKIYQPLLLLGLLVVIGVSVVYHNQTEETVIDEKVLERAYQDVITELDEVAKDYIESIMTIKVFDQENELVDYRVLSPDEIADEAFNTLLYQSSLIAEYQNSRIYRIDK